MKRALISIALPLVILAVAWQFAPADVEFGEAGSVAATQVEVENAVGIRVVKANVPATQKVSAVEKPESKTDYKRLLENNPELVKLVIERTLEIAESDGASGETQRFLGMALCDDEGAAAPYLLAMLDEADDPKKAAGICSLIHVAASYRNFPIEDAVPRLVKLMKSPDETLRTAAWSTLIQILPFVHNEKARTDYNEWFRTDGT